QPATFSWLALSWDHSISETAHSLSRRPRMLALGTCSGRCSSRNSHRSISRNGHFGGVVGAQVETPAPTTTGRPFGVLTMVVALAIGSYLVSVDELVQPLHVKSQKLPPQKANAQALPIVTPKGLASPRIFAVALSI